MVDVLIQRVATPRTQEALRDYEQRAQVCRSHHPVRNVLQGASRGMSSHIGVSCWRHEPQEWRLWGGGSILAAVDLAEAERESCPEPCRVL